MLCENCGKNEATVHFKKIINGQKTEVHLCEQCAKGNENLLSSENDFTFNHLLSSFLNFDSVFNNNPIKTNYEELQCKNCGMTFSQFKKIGKFGCSDCYKYFDTQLDPILRRIHGNNQHNGKIPHKSGTKLKLKKDLNFLKNKLQQKIINEEFEEAAKIRDEIKVLELKLSKEGE